jgi:predicted metalloprotease with PDZ domain
VAIQYRLDLPEPHTHLLDVRVRIPASDGELDLVMPSWTPGSYLLREFPRNVQDFRAFDSTGLPLAWRKIDKNTWRIGRAEPGPTTVSYRVYANELSVRTSHLDATHGYVNGASVFMYIRGREGEAARVEVRAPPGWRVATSLRAQEDGTFRAADYDELVDCPLEIGTHRTIAWEQEGVPHRYAIWGGEEIDENRLEADTRQVVRVCSELFGGLPFDRYLFILHVVPEARGGLEHASSCSLAVPPAWTSGPEYENLIALVAHEFFHVWLGKRIRPEPLGPFDYTAENYTRNLWVVEGFTTYYTDRILLRAGLMTVERYLERLGDSIARLRALPGRHHQSLEESSFDAWIRFYRPDPHTPNSQVSYYHKGSLVALAIDLELMRASRGQRSLDDVMRILWERYGRTGVGWPEDRERGIQAVVEEVYGGSLAELFASYVAGVDEIDFDGHLEAAGLRLASSAGDGGGEGSGLERPGTAGAQGPELREPHGARDTVSGAPKPTPSDAAAIPPVRPSPPPPCETGLGLRLRDAAGRIRVTHVLSGSPGHAAGINAGDEILAVDGWRPSLAALNRRIEAGRAGSSVSILLLRRDRVVPAVVTLGAEVPRKARIVPLAPSGPDQLAVRRAWLGGGARERGTGDASSVDSGGASG